MLSVDEPLESDSSLSDIEYEINEGHHSGVVRELRRYEVTEATMRGLLIAQGSDPDFLIEDPDDILTIGDEINMEQKGEL